MWMASPRSARSPGSAADHDGCERISIEKEEIEAVYEESRGADADIVALGCPHCSREELERIADLLAGQRVQREMWVCTARKIRDSCPELVERIESSGARVFCDTCMVVSPATEGFGRMMVNSGKALVYLPGLGGGCRLRQPGRVHRCRFGEEEMTEIPCHKVASGFASGPALTTRMAISFLGNVDPRTGMVVDPGHELYGQKISGKVLIFPGKGLYSGLLCHLSTEEERSGPGSHDQSPLRAHCGCRGHHQRHPSGG